MRTEGGGFAANVTVEAVAVYVLLSTLASGRFEDNAFLTFQLVLAENRSLLRRGPRSTCCGGSSSAAELHQIVGECGDAVLMHPWLVHSGTTNLSNLPRILLNGMARVTEEAQRVEAAQQHLQTLQTSRREVPQATRRWWTVRLCGACARR